MSLSNHFSEEQYYTILALLADDKESVYSWKNIDHFSLFFVPLYLNSDFLLDKLCYTILDHTNYWTIRSLFLLYLPEGERRTRLVK